MRKTEVCRYIEGQPFQTAGVLSGIRKLSQRIVRSGDDGRGYSDKSTVEASAIESRT